MDVPGTVRALRARHRLSQRELANRAGVPPSTVGRIESGATDPRVSTLVQLAAAVGTQLVIADLKGRVLAVDEWHDDLVDRANRHFPAHLEAAKTPEYMSLGRNWWGWHHIAFPPCDDKRRPAFTYWRRRKPWPQMWNDAT